jgi:hypothetical protein
MAKEKKRGPKGGIQHQPGRGHDSKSAPQRQDRFRRKARRKREQEREAAKKQWEVWDAFTDEQKKLRPELRPTLPRPADDS